MFHNTVENMKFLPVFGGAGSGSELRIQGYEALVKCGEILFKVLLLDGISEHAAHARGKICLLEE